MIPKLPRRQRQVFIRRALGWSNRAIALDLGITTSTVEIHATALRRRLNVKTYDLASFVRIAAGPLCFAP